jgi:hypothetical protein
MMKRHFAVVVVIVLMLTGVQGVTSPSLAEANSPVFQKGLSLPSWWHDTLCSASADESLKTLADTGADWIQIVPTWYQQDGTSNKIESHRDRTVDEECLVHAITRAHELGMKVMLKPHVDALDGTWRGEFEPKRPEQWFKSYERMMKYYARLAKENGVEMLSVGCEFGRITGPDYTQSWEKIITSVRKIYSGSLIYAANWSGSGEYNIQFWDKLDYIGIDAYFELTQKTDPTVDELVAAWQQYLPGLEALHTQWQLPIVFTEIGYRSVDGANIHPWKSGSDGPVDLQEQADCYEAAFSSLWSQPWFYGTYWWSWEPRPDAGGPEDADYTPQNKPAEDVIKAWYGQ